METRLNTEQLKKPEAFFNYKIDLSKEEAEALKKLGLQWISQDEDALIDYAINKMLYDISQNLTKKVAFLEKIKKQEQKNTKG